MQLDFLSQDSKLASALADREAAPEGLTIESAHRLPGQTDTLFQTVVQLATIPAAVASGLIVNWIWAAVTRSKATLKVSLLVRTVQGEVVVHLEGCDRETARTLVQGALERVSDH